MKKEFLKYMQMRMYEMSRILLLAMLLSALLLSCSSAETDPPAENPSENEDETEAPVNTKETDPPAKNPSENEDETEAPVNTKETDPPAKNPSENEDETEAPVNTKETDPPAENPSENEDETICSVASITEKITIPSVANKNSIALACPDGIALLTREGSARLLHYPSIEDGSNPCIPETPGEACLSSALEASSANHSFAASFGKKHLLYFSAASTTLSLIELDRAWSDFAFSPQGAYLIVLDHEGYLHWFDANDSFSKVHSFPIRNETWYKSAAMPIANFGTFGTIASAGFDDDISNAQWPAFSLSQRYIFVLRAEPGAGGSIYRIPLTSNNESDPSVFLQSPQVGEEVSGFTAPEIDRIDLPSAAVSKGSSDTLIPADLRYSGFIARLTAGISKKEVGRLYITHQNSGAVRICSASEAGATVDTNSWLNFSPLEIDSDYDYGTHLSKDGKEVYFTEERSFTTRALPSPEDINDMTPEGSVDTDSVCNSLEEGLGLNANPAIKHSALKRFVYLRDSNNNLKIINNDYYYQYHIDHPHDRLKDYAVLPLALKAKRLTSFYYYQEPYEALSYYARSKVEAAFTATVAVLDGANLRYFQESSICSAIALDSCPEGTTALEEAAIHTKATGLSAGVLLKVMLLGDHVFYIYREDGSLKLRKDTLSWP